MSTHPKLLTPVQSATENPRVEFCNGQFLFRMTNQEGGIHERFVSHASIREAFSGIAIDSGWLRPEVVRWGDGQNGEWAVVFIPLGVHELEITREGVRGQGEGDRTEEAGEPAVPEITSTVERIKTPLPGLVFFGLGTKYYIWAVKTSHLDPYHEVYRCPLPNVEANALICWGPLKPPRATARTIFDAFELFIKSTFNNHRCEGKSKKFREDVRIVLREASAQIQRVTITGLVCDEHSCFEPVCENPEHRHREISTQAEAGTYQVADLVRQVDHVGVTLDKAIREFFETGEMPE